MRRFFLLFGLVIIGTSLFGQKILFVGNSLTYSNDLPAMVKDIGKAFGEKIQTECLCFPNYGLEDHWNQGLVQQKIKEGEFDFVVFQQGPSSQRYGRESLLEYGGKISDYALQFNTKPAYFMVWPSLQYYSTFDGVIKNHRDAAQENKALLIPLGEYWKAYRLIEGHSSLYGIDGFHPSKAGSFLAALAIFNVLLEKKDLKTLKSRKLSRYVDAKTFNQMIEILGY